MIDHSDSEEKRAHIRALSRLVEHIGRCPDCAERVRAGMPDEPAPSLEPPPIAPVIDISDPRTPLCTKGAELRDAAVLARSSTPAERLIGFYALEGVCLDGSRCEVSAVDGHDCSRFAAWLREDPGRARIIFDRLIDRAGPLEERTESTPELREASLKGFRHVSPSRGPAPSAEQRERRTAAAARLVALIAERYENRHGLPPPPEALDSFRRGHEAWIEGSGDLERMAYCAEKFRAEHARRWKLKAMLRPKSPFDELKKIARWIAEELIKEEAGKG